MLNGLVDTTEAKLDDARKWALKVYGDPAQMAGFNALMDILEVRVFEQWRAGAFEDWAPAWAELDAIKRLRYAVQSMGEIEHGKATSDNKRSKRGK